MEQTGLRKSLQKIQGKRVDDGERAHGIITTEFYIFLGFEQPGYTILFWFRVPDKCPAGEE